MELDAGAAAANAAGRPKEPSGVPQVVIPAADELHQRRKRGRPKVIDEELRHKLVALLGAGASLTQTAAHVGVGRNTIARALEHDEEFALEVHEARQRAQLFPLNCLLREAAKNWRAAAWLLTHLERQAHQERSRRERILAAANEQIERDLVQELREQARRERQAAQDEQSPAERQRSAGHAPWAGRAANFSPRSVTQR